MNRWQSKASPSWSVSHGIPGLTTMLRLYDTMCSALPPALFSHSRFIISQKMEFFLLSAMPISHVEKNNVGVSKRSTTAQNGV